MSSSSSPGLFGWMREPKWRGAPTVVGASSDRDSPLTRELSGEEREPCSEERELCDEEREPFRRAETGLKTARATLESSPSVITLTTAAIASLRRPLRYCPIHSGPAGLVRISFS